MTDERARAAAEEIERAKQEVFAICKGRHHGGHEWRMSIPVNEEHDSDRIIMAGLTAHEAEVKELRAAIEDLFTPGPGIAVPEPYPEREEYEPHKKTWNRKLARLRAALVRAPDQP